MWTRILFAIFHTRTQYCFVYATYKYKTNSIMGELEHGKSIYVEQQRQRGYVKASRETCMHSGKTLFLSEMEGCAKLNFEDDQIFANNNEAEQKNEVDQSIDLHTSCFGTGTRRRRSWNTIMPKRALSFA